MGSPQTDFKSFSKAFKRGSQIVFKRLMPDAVRHFYDFDRFRIDVAERVLLSDGEIIPLTQKSFDVLLTLVERRGQIVEKEELLRQVWPDTFVEEEIFRRTFTR